MNQIRPIERADIKGPALYEGMREDFRDRLIEFKKDRRISVGDRVTLVFENRLTLLFQIEEMLRAEGLTTDEQIQAEIDVYNEIMPTEDSLSATLFIELPRDVDKRAELDRMIGLDEHVILHIGDHSVRAQFEEGRGTSERISAVQYTRYPLTIEAKEALCREGTKVRIEIDHPAYQHETAMPEAMRASLAADYASASS